MERTQANSSRQSFIQWLEHALASIIAAIFATGAIYQLPSRYQPYAIAALGVIGYLVGVRVPAPGTSGGAPSDHSGRGGEDGARASNETKLPDQSKQAEQLLQGQF